MDFVIYGIILVLIVAAGLFMWMALSKKHALTESAVTTIQNRWREIEEMMASEESHAWNRAIMEADKLVDYALKEKRIVGETMGERLKNGKSLFRNVQPVWEAHKLRNRLAHEMNITLNKGEADRAIAQFRQGLRELQAL